MCMYVHVVHVYAGYVHCVVVSSVPQSPPLNRSKQTVVCALTRWCLFSNHQYGMSAICKVVHCMYNCTLCTCTAPSPSNVSKQTVESGSDLLLTAVSTVQVLRRQIGFSLSTNPQPIPTTPHTFQECPRSLFWIFLLESSHLLIVIAHCQLNSVFMISFESLFITLTPELVGYIML